MPLGRILPPLPTQPAPAVRSAPAGRPSPRHERTRAVRRRVDAGGAAAVRQASARGHLQPRY